MVLRLPRLPLDFRPFAEAVYDLQRQWAVAVAFHTGVAVERLVAAVRGVVVPPDEVELATINETIERVMRERFG
jgi:hypothetical protein